MRTAAGSTGSLGRVPPVVHEVLRSSGQPLDAATRAYMEPRFGHDFSQVRVHTDSKALESARSVNALAYTVGRDIVFGPGQYIPSSIKNGLLAHELAHVIQQRGVAHGATEGLHIGQSNDAQEQEAASVGASVMRRQEVPRTLTGVPEAQVQRQKVGMGDVKKAEAEMNPRIDYPKAEKSNKAHATSLSWATKLAEVAKGAYRVEAEAWQVGNYNLFADLIALYQTGLGLPKKSVDGVLGPATWARMAGLGEAMAGIEKVKWKDSESVCTIATEERIKRGYQLATGTPLMLAEDKSRSIFNVILQSISGRMLDVDVEYRGTGAAGALVYSGLGEFVSEAEIWAGGLRPGAAMQVWGSRDAYDLLRVGEITPKGGKTRRITDSDANFYGTSFVFVQYDPQNSERMQVRHFGRSEWRDKSDYEVWVGANTR